MKLELTPILLFGEKQVNLTSLLKLYG